MWLEKLYWIFKFFYLLPKVNSSLLVSTRSSLWINLNLKLRNENTDLFIQIKFNFTFPTKFSPQFYTNIFTFLLFKWPSVYRFEFHQGNRVNFMIRAIWGCRLQHVVPLGRYWEPYDEADQSKFGQSKLFGNRQFSW